MAHFFKKKTLNDNEYSASLNDQRERYFLKMAIPGLSFFYFRLFCTFDSKMFNINFADDWIRASDLWSLPT